MFKDIRFDGIDFHNPKDWFLGFGHEIIWYNGYWHRFQFLFISFHWHYAGNYK